MCVWHHVKTVFISCCAYLLRRVTQDLTDFLTAGALDEVDWLRSKLERLETSISAMARSAAAGPTEGGAPGMQSQSQPGQVPQDYKYDK